MKEINNISHKLYSLTKQDSNIIKAVAILLIVFHNYIHLLVGFGENEMKFDQENIYEFFSSVTNNPWGVLLYFLSFFGHYGVQLFVFISAYGLTKKHMKVGIKSYPLFVVDRLVKIYALLIAGLLFLFVVELRILPLDTYIEVSTHYLSMINNFSYDTYYYHMGPWWFFELIVQLYILFPLLFWAIKRHNIKGAIALTLVSYLVMYLLYYNEDKVNFPVFANATGHLPEFILGICIALFPPIKIDGKVVIASLVLFVASLFFEVLFPLSFLAVTPVMLYIMKPLFNISKTNMWIKLLVFVGQISMFMFVTNGVIRTRTFKWMLAYDHNNTFKLMGFSLAHVLLTILASLIMYFIYRWIAKYIKRYTGVSIL